MTENTNKLRAVFLTALMIGSVFAAGIAFTGGAAADATSLSATNGPVDPGDTLEFDVTNSSAGDDGDLIVWIDNSTDNTLNSSEARATDSTTADGNTWSGSLTVPSSLSSGTYTLAAAENATAVDGNTTADVTTTFTVTDPSYTPDADAYYGFSSEPEPSLVWTGQQVAATGYNSGESVTVEEVGDESNSTVRQLTANNNGTVTWDTSGASSADYQITDGESATTYPFEVLEQNLDTVAFDPTDLEQSMTTELEIQSNRGNGQYAVVAYSDGLDFDQLSALFSQYDSGVLTGVDLNDDDEADAVAFQHEAAQEITIPDEFETGDYDINFAVADSTATGSSSLNVSQAGAGDASFAAGSFEETRGDWATITLDVVNTDSGTMYVGSEGAGYLAEVDYTLGDEDDSISILMNTYTAGQTTTADEDSVYMAAGDNDDQIDNVSLITDRLDNPLAATDYTVNATVSGQGETDLSTLFLNERSTTGASSWVAPSGADTGDWDEINDAASESSDVALGDKAVVKYDVTGINGYVNDGYNLSSGSTNATQDGVYVSITETEATAPANGQPNTLNVSNASTVYDAANDSFYVVMDTGAFTDEDLTEGDEYRATLVINEENPYVEDTTPGTVQMETVNSTFTVEEASASFDGLNDEDVLAVPPQSEVQVTGSTNLAPGSEVTIRARSTSQGNSFSKAPTVTVQDDGSINATYDFTGYEEGTEFTWTAQSSGFGDLTDGGVDGLITSDAAGTTTPGTTTDGTDTTADGTDTTADGTDTTADGTDTTADGTDTTEDDDGGSGSGIPGFGVGIALVALLGAALLALRE